jgi:uncharacterized protein YndB with AHSA1/START domain
MTQTREGLTLKLNRTLDAPVADVFSALTTADRITRWYGPSDDYKVEVHEWDLKVGGTYRISLNHKDGNVHTVHGTFREILEGEKLSYTWSWEGQPPLDSLVTFRLREVQGKTDLTFTHEGFPDAELRDKHEMGWTGSLERLARAIA